jgi:hypothetical protein
MQPNCECGKKAKWFYAPARKDEKITDIAFCEECVPRGCSCNDYDLEDIDKEELNNVIEVAYDGGHKAYRHLDNKGLEEPCCEFDFNEKESDWDWFDK